MRANLFSIQRLREAARPGHSRAVPALPQGLAILQPAPLPPRIDYDIPTYIRRGIKLSGLPQER